MLERAVTSLYVGGIISALAFVPLLIWQYRRYGRPAPGRMVWTAIVFVYVTALIAYTLFPMPDMSGDYCATHPASVVLDPRVYFIEMAENLAGMGLKEILLSWDVLQMMFNVALFIPLGVIFSDFLVIKERFGIPLGLASSLLVELTQYTANWGLADCPYRVADVNDLITNTTGTVIGYLVALMIPRFVARPEYLRKRRHRAAPVTRMRRWTGMGLDLFFWVFAWGVVYATCVVIVGVQAQLGGTQFIGDPSWWVWIFAVSGAVVGALLVCSSAFTFTGASWGQRVVWLRPVAASRWRIVVSRLAVQGAMVLVLVVPGWLFGTVVMVWLVADFLSVIWRREGLSYLVTGCRIVDSRATVGDEPGE